uniref:Uncharacterized protein n=1 Tax=Arundo donax TaxID=35708 RepID=A0A0A9GJ33_ARUDO
MPLLLQFIPRCVPRFQIIPIPKVQWLSSCNVPWAFLFLAMCLVFSFSASPFQRRSCNAETPFSDSEKRCRYISQLLLSSFLQHSSESFLCACLSSSDIFFSVGGCWFLLYYGFRMLKWQTICHPIQGGTMSEQ